MTISTHPLLLKHPHIYCPHESDSPAPGHITKEELAGVSREEGIKARDLELDSKCHYSLPIVPSPETHQTHQNRKYLYHGTTSLGCSSCGRLRREKGTLSCEQASHVCPWESSASHHVKSHNKSEHHHKTSDFKLLFFFLFFK